MPKPIAGKTALTRIQRLNTGTIQTLETNVQKSPNIKKPFFAVLKANEEIACIRWHMGAFDDRNNWEYYTRAVAKFPNVMYTHAADMAAAYIVGV